MPSLAMERENNQDKPNINIGNWKGYLQELESNRRSKKIVAEIMKEMREERNAGCRASFLHLLPAELSSAIPNF